MKIINFNEKLRECGQRWLTNTPKKFSDYEEIKKENNLIYNTWADLPADWLEGLTPREYFWRIENPEELIDLLLEYADRFKEEIPPVLIERIIELGDKAIKPLLSLASNEDLMLINSRGKGQGPIKAVQLLGSLKATEAIERVGRNDPCPAEAEKNIRNVVWQVTTVYKNTFAELGLVPFQTHFRKPTNLMLLRFVGFIIL